MTREERQRKKDDERRELAAMMLVDAVFETDAKVAERYDADEKTLRNYRRQAATDPILKGMVEARLAERRAAWAPRLHDALNEGLETVASISRAIRTDPTFKANPGALKEVADSVYKVAEIELTLRTLNAGSQRQNREERGEADRPGEDDGAGADRPN